MISLDNKELELNFPCEWEYRVIGEFKEKIEIAVFEIIDKKYQLKASKVSKKGKYKSFSIKISVESDKERIIIFEKLKQHSDIKMVL